MVRFRVIEKKSNRKNVSSILEQAAKSGSPLAKPRNMRVKQTMPAFNLSQGRMLGVTDHPRLE